MAARFINSIWRKAPRWLQEGDGELVWTSIGLVCDALVERVRQGVEARWPQYAPSDALGLIGRDRKIRRGRDETDASYAARLLQWLDDWKVAGNPFALMGQLRAYCGVDLRMRTVDNSGNWYTVEADGSRSVLLAQGNWDWDSQPTKWARFWVVMYPPSTLWVKSPALGNASLWGGAIGSSGYTIGSSATPAEVAAVKSIVRDWKPAGTTCVRIILAWDDADFDPEGASPPNPDGDWDKSSNRIANACYWNPNHG